MFLKKKKTLEKILKVVPYLIKHSLHSIFKIRLLELDKYKDSLDNYYAVK
jgi:hypothetical protein